MAVSVPPRVRLVGTTCDIVFIQSSILDTFDCTVQVLEEAPMSPHSPVVLSLEGIVEEPVVREEAACKSFPLVPIGHDPKSGVPDPLVEAVEGP
eukprot:5859704-Pyramimonas_sp.AAC.1